MIKISKKPQCAETHILLAHSDAVTRRALHLLLVARGHNVKAYALESGVSPDPGVSRGSCLIAEHRPPHMDGTALLRDLRARHHWQHPAILLATEKSEGLEAEARTAGYAHVLHPPFAHHVLLDMVDNLVGTG